MRRGRILILLGLILAIGTAAVIFFILSQSDGEAVPEVEKKEVVVAIQPIGEDEPVEGRVELRPLAVDSIPPGALESVEQTASMLAAGPIPQGIPILPEMLISPEDRMREGELGKLIEEGFVAVAFPIDELSSVSYGIQPGDHVDILMTLSFVEIDQESQITQPLCPFICPGATAGENEAVSFTSDEQNPRLVSQLTVWDAEVLGVGRWGYEPPTTEEEEETPARQGEPAAQPELPEYITLMLRPQDALVLKLAREYGASIDLAVRAQDDHQQFPTEQVTLDYIMFHYGISLPNKQPYTLNTLQGQNLRPETGEE